VTLAAEPFLPDEPHPSELEADPWHVHSSDHSVEFTEDDQRIVPLEEFAAVEEEGAEPLIGTPDCILFPEGGSAMVYGDGGAGKTTLCVDLACHLAAGAAWLGMPVPRPVRVLLIENEGPRPLFRAKLRRKLDAWQGSPVSGRVLVWQEPWAELTFADERWREELAAHLERLEIDVIIVGPVTAAGMNEAGTIQDVRLFDALLRDVRRRAGRRVTFLLVHHENKGGSVSGAWEGAGDALLHVQGQGHGRTRLFMQKVRWGSTYHQTTLSLAWTDGEGFAVDVEPKRGDNTIADEILAAALADPGASWNAIDKKTAGKGERKREIRDRLLAGGRLIDAGDKGGMKLWHADDPAIPHPQGELRPEGDAPGTHPASRPGAAGVPELRASPAAPQAGRRDSVGGAPAKGDEDQVRPCVPDVYKDAPGDAPTRAAAESAGDERGCWW
jgi:AAA domain